MINLNWRISTVRHVVGVYDRVVAVFLQPIKSKFLEIVGHIWNALFGVFLKVFRRPKLANESLQRSATVFADFFAIEIIYTLIDFAVNVSRFSYLGIQNYVLYITMMFLIRYHAVKGRLKFSVIVYGVSVVYFYLLVTADLGYFEHLQAANMIIVVAFATITMGPGPGFVALLASLALFITMRMAASSGILTPLVVLLPDKVSDYRQEWLEIVTNLVEMYLFCWLVRSHIFSQLGKSISREREIAERAVKARRAADKAEGDKTRFLASASHDLRQPVSSLVLNFGAHFDAHPEFESDPAVADMRSSIESLNRMLEGILTVSKLDAKVMVPRISTVSLNEVLERCYAANAAVGRQKGLDVRMRKTDLYCKTDQEMLFRALNNIVNNAIKYTNKGGILFGVRKRFGVNAIFVIDSGIGIPNDSLSSIYDEFKMLIDTSRKSGSGLGLSIVRKILLLLGMNIHTLSKVNVGSTFYIEIPHTYSIPSVVKSPLPLASDQSTTPETPATQNLGGLLVAVVDDVEILRKSICRVLEINGMRTIDAGGLDELEELLKHEHPDVLITDYKLENDVTGYDIIVAARKIVSESIPCFIITGDTDPALVHEMSDRGVEVCYKPITGKMLVEAIARHLNTREVKTLFSA